MSRREALLSAAVVFVVAVLVRWWAASLVVFPKPEDTAYYVDVARNLLSGRGLVSDALWSFQTQPLVVPRAAFEVWLPLPTFLAAVPMALFGSTFAAAQVSSVVIGSVVPVLAWRLAADVAAERGLASGRARTLAIGTGLTAAVSLPLILHSTLPDSTMLFAVLTLGATLLMSRLVRRIEAARVPDGTTGTLALLGIVIGLGALTRNEAIWLGLVWAILALRLPLPRGDRLRLIAIPAVVAILFYAPWAIRDWIAFGNPLPGQALSNALSLDGTDIFAWQDPPTLSRYLAAGLPTLVGLRVTGIGHNLFDVLLFPGAPLSFIGLIGLPWAARLRSIQPLLLVSIVVFLVTAIVFPVSTTWGTFLHAAGATHVLLIVSALLALDALIAWVGQRRGWTRPVAWLAPTLTIAGSILFSAVILPSFGAGSGATARTFEDLSARLTVAGATPDTGKPVITDFPIWLPYVHGGTSLALPHEPASSVLDLARTFGATTVAVLEGDALRGELASGSTDAACFRDVTPPAGQAPDPAASDDSLRVYRIVCP
ncbi:MAG TPA: hypothetical protein VH440_01415 [Candidatus Limnocylindrales bacterium]